MTGAEKKAVEGKVVLVTGASRRVGRCYALSLAKAGARVVALARSMGDDPDQPGTLAEVAAAGRKAGVEISTYRCDLANEDEIRAVMDVVVERFGGIDILVNNAVVHMRQMDALTVSRDVWEEAMRINVRAPYVLSTLAVPHMIARGGGSIVNISALAGDTPAKGYAHHGLVHYGVSKAALNRLTTWFAAEFADANIAVNSLSPGSATGYLQLVNGVDGPAEEGSGAEHDLDEAFWGNPLVYLAGARPADVTGQILHTYNFGESWGPRHATPPDWSPAIRELLAR